MYALFIEVDVDDFKVEEARKGLNEVAVPMAQQHGATAGYWLGPKGGRGMSVVIFDSEDAAQKMADSIKVGDPAGPPEAGATFKTIEVREVLAHL